jgi:hypothetical protein
LHDRLLIHRYAGPPLVWTPGQRVAPRHDAAV